jgi:hypothetical protein
MLNLPEKSIGKCPENQALKLFCFLTAEMVEVLVGLLDPLSSITIMSSFE